MKKRRFRRVKEGMFRLGMSMIASGLMLVFIAPLPLIASPRNPDQPNSVWQTQLVLAESTPTLLASATPTPEIQVAPSRYEESLAKSKKVKKQTVKPIASVASVTVASSGPCSGSVSEAEKQEWAAKAAAANGIPASLLSAIWQVESGKTFCSTTTSYAGAQGPLQFLPSTWRGYAVDGNGDGSASIYDARDALFGAARLLAANGAASGNYWQAALAYNHSSAYANRVLSLAGL